MYSITPRTSWVWRQPGTVGVGWRWRPSPIFLLYLLVIMLILLDSWWSVIITRSLWEFNLKLCKAKLGVWNLRSYLLQESPVSFSFSFFLIRGFRQSLVNNVWESPVITLLARVAHATKLWQISVRFSFKTDLLSYKLSNWRLKENKEEEKAWNKDKFSDFFIYNLRQFVWLIAGIIICQYFIISKILFVDTLTSPSLYPHLTSPHRYQTLVHLVVMTVQKEFLNKKKKIFIIR